MLARHWAAVTIAISLGACGEKSGLLPTAADTPTLVAHNTGGSASDDRNHSQQDHEESGVDDRRKNEHDKPDVRDRKREHDDDECRNDHGEDSDRRYRDDRYRNKDRHHGDDDDDDRCPGGGTGSPGSIAGNVTNDAAAAVGWNVYLISSNGTVTSTQTSATGAYSFTNVAPGTYRVCEADPSPLFEIVPATPAAACSSPYAPLGYSLTVTAGGNLSGNNFANSSPV